MICQFSEPKNIGTEPKPDFEFSKIVCEEATTTLLVQPNEIYELIINPENPEREFYVSKTFSYGDALIVFFLTLFLISAIAKFIFNFFWKK